MGFTKEGIRQAKEAWKVLEWCGDTVAQAQCLTDLARLLYSDKQLNAAEEAAYGVIDLITEEGNPYLFCQSHPLLGYIYRSKGEREESIHNFKVALRIASCNWHGQLFSVHRSL